VIRVALPLHLRNLARVTGEVHLEVPPPASARSVLDALEARHPALRGTIRDPRTGRRRPHVRFFACRTDWSHEPTEGPLPEAVARGEEPFVVLGALAGG